MDKWIGKVAVVTGASSGIGRNIAKILVEKGLIVVGLARRFEIVAKDAEALLAGPGKLIAMKCDVSKEDQVKTVFEEIQKNHGPVAILINNAGLVKKNDFLTGEPKVWKEILETNLYGLAVCTHEAAKQMRANDNCGHIININSVAGHKVIDSEHSGASMYPSSKHGVTAFTEVMRQELRNNKTKIKITSISPGVVKTDIFEAGGFSEFNEETFKLMPFLNPEDVSEAILYALGTKPHVQVHEIIIKPLGENF